MILVIPHIQLKNVVHVLCLIVVFFNQQIKLWHVDRGHQGLRLHVIRRCHVENKNIPEIVVVDVCNINAHPGEGNLICGFLDLIGNGPVFVVDIHDIREVIVIHEVDVEPTVIVEVADAEAQTKRGSQQAGLFSHIGKLAIVVAVKVTRIFPELFFVAEYFIEH